MGASPSRPQFPSGVSIPWHRTKIEPKVKTELHKTDDVKAAIQTVGFLANLALWFGLAVYSFHHNYPYAAFFFTMMYGMQANFLINGMHELGHGFVFRTKLLNDLFLRIISFLGWLHPDMFFQSHIRHHRFTQNFPHDQENPMPVIYTMNTFLSFGFVNVYGAYDIILQTVRAALGVYPTGHLGWLPGWEEICYPATNPENRKPAMLWAQFMLIGHALIAIYSVMQGWYLVPILISFGPFLNGWLFWLCNSTQHVGLPHGNFDKETVNDFRLNTRTFYLNNPIVRFWYWHMNFHTEHHMYPAVPCYNLAGLHDAIKHELPPTPNGIIGVWKVILDVLDKQRKDPNYTQDIELPQFKNKD
eukprot:m.66152 g.66152  ORF g.66152 m.66152 type:complete len:359 (-) comp11785_c0_seq2:20-1096(-)